MDVMAFYVSIYWVSFCSGDFSKSVNFIENWESVRGEWVNLTPDIIIVFVGDNFLGGESLGKLMF